MNFTNIKLTQNQQLLVNAFLSMFASALVSAAQAAYQYMTQHGTINLAQVVAVFGGVLWLSFSTALVAYVPAHIQQELDDLRVFKDQVLAQPSTPAQPLVVIHTTGASVQSDVPKSVSSVPAVAIPPRPKAPQQIALTNPTGGSTVPVPMPEAPQQVWLSTTLSGSSGVQQTTTDDVLGDLPVSTGQPIQVNQITGMIPTYGASGK